MIKTLKALQDVLGRHQDREVQVGDAALAAGPRSSAASGGPAALMAMGVLVERLEDDRGARGSSPTRFAAFASKPQRKLVKDTFG